MCSTIILGSGPEKFLAANYDINITHGLIATSLRGTTKENARQAGAKVVRWSVKYGSVTFNQCALELPAFGMNEKGLAIALMWHDNGDFGENDRYARLDPLQWIQYQLDTCQNINDVIEGLKTVRPRKEYIPLHFMLLDSNGDSLVVEFFDGEPLLQKNPEPPVLTNSSYQSCLALAQTNRTEYPSSSSTERFVHLYQKVATDQQTKLRELTDFEYLDEVNQTPGGEQRFPWNHANKNNTVTAWSMHFCPAQKKIIYKTHLNDSIREILLDNHNFEATAQYTLMNVNDGPAGNVDKLFVPYAKDYNRQIVQKTGQAIPISEAVQEGIIQVVDTMYQKREIQF